jgi:glycerophosphoryl diester phosphodiesterase
MKVISHRGNIRGADSTSENSIESINLALEEGFDVEVDVWLRNDKWYLGHDEPIHSISKNFLANKKLWCHAKNLEALHSMLENKDINCFWHQNDDFTLTSKGFIWTYPNKQVTSKSIIVLQEKENIDPFKKYIYGVCTDYPIFYKNND